jgi:murein DD-endopeptidase MepM/ murein hydrolase activator NlpD
MANKMLSNIQSVTNGVATLTQKVNELYAAVDKVAGVAEGAVSGVQGSLRNMGGTMHLGSATSRPGTGADGARFATPSNAMPSYRDMDESMGKFSYQPSAFGGGFGGGFRQQSYSEADDGGISQASAGAQNMGIGGLKMAIAPLAGAYAAMPDLALTMQREIGYYQAALRAPGINRAQFQSSFMASMRGGMSSVGSDALTAALLAGRGFTPGTANFTQAGQEIAGAYRYLGIENAAAASAIAGFQSGPMGANLYQYGISTYDPQTGKNRSVGAIAKDLMNVMAPGGVSGAKAVNESFLRGALGANLRTMGFDAAQQEMLRQAMVDISEGRNPDLATALPAAGNPNTVLDTAARLNMSQTDLMNEAAKGMVKGFENAADTVEAFNRALKPAAEELGYFRGLIGGVGGTNVGQGIATFATVFSDGVKQFVTGVKQLIDAIPLVGGGTSGFGAGFGANRLGGRGGSAPVSGPISAAYGAQDNSGIWSGTNGKHTGIDYAVPKGTPVVAQLPGTVSSVNPGPDYGTAVVIDHDNGYQTVYGHLSSRDVKVGDQIKPGQRIGKSGDSGNVTGPHLHYEVRRGKNNPVDPNSLEGSKGNFSLAMAAYSEDFASALAIKPGSKGSSSPNSSSSANYVSVKGTGSEIDWAKKFLTKINAPLSEGNISALTTWMRFEGGHWQNSASYNPLNTTLNVKGSLGSMNPVGVKRYDSWETGLSATVQTLLGNKSVERGYADIVAAMQGDAGVSAILNAVNNSAWRSGKTGDPGYQFPKGGATSGYGASITQTRNEPGTNNVYITVKFEQPDDQSARRFAQMVESYLKRKDNNSAIGSV